MKVIYALIYLSKKIILSVLKNIEKILKIDGRYKVGNYSYKIYKNQKEAYKDARKYIMWLKYKI